MNSPDNSMRSHLGRARGAGSTGTGSHHWKVQRLTAVALIPLSLWFVVSFVRLINADYDTFIAWLGIHGNLIGLVIFMMTLFWHAALGLQVIIEDYIHCPMKKPILLIGVKFLCVVMAVAGVLSAIRLSVS